MEPPAAEKLLRKIQDLEAAHAHLREEMSKFAVSDTHISDSVAVAKVAPGQRSYSVSPQLSRSPAEGAGRWRHGVGVSGDVGAGQGLDYYASWKKVTPSFGYSPFPLQGGSRGGDGLSLRDFRGGAGGGGPRFDSPVVQLSDKEYLNILQSMGQAIHIMDVHDQIIYWNRPAENLYGYTAAEAMGKSVFELLVDKEHVDLGANIVNRVKMGESWTGLFPVKSKMGRRFSIIVTDTPLYDEDGTTIGVVCVASDSRPFEDMRFTLPDTYNSETNVSFSRAKNSVSTKLVLDPDQPLQVVIASKITDLAAKVSNKVRSKMKTGRNIVDHEVERSDSCRRSEYGSSGATPSHNKDGISSYEASLRGNATPSFFGTVSQTGESASKLSKGLGEESERRTAIHKITSKAEAWISKKVIQWPWKGNEQEFSEAKSSQFGSSWLQGDQDNDLVLAEVHRSWSSSVNVSSSSSMSSCGTPSTSSSSAKKPDIETECLDYEIFWEDLIFREQIGQGCCNKSFL